MERLFRTVKIKDRLPDFGKRILFLNENYKGEYMFEYDPTGRIPMKKGTFIEMQNSPRCIEIIKGEYTDWLEEVTEK